MTLQHVIHFVDDLGMVWEWEHVLLHPWQLTLQKQLFCRSDSVYRWTVFYCGIFIKQLGRGRLGPLSHLNFNM